MWTRSLGQICSRHNHLKCVSFKVPFKTKLGGKLLGRNSMYFGPFYFPTNHSLSIIHESSPCLPSDTLKVMFNFSSPFLKRTLPPSHFALISKVLVKSSSFLCFYCHHFHFRLPASLTWVNLTW